MLQFPFFGTKPSTRKLFLESTEFPLAFAVVRIIIPGLTIATLIYDKLSWIFSSNLQGEVMATSSAFHSNARSMIDLSTSDANGSREVRAL